MSETSHYRSCTPEEELELSRVVERDLRERIRELEEGLRINDICARQCVSKLESAYEELHAENDRLLDVNADLFEALAAILYHDERGQGVGYAEAMIAGRIAILKARGEEPPR